MKSSWQRVGVHLFFDADGEGEFHMLIICGG
jgi:hypothetical protein